MIDYYDENVRKNLSSHDVFEDIIERFVDFNSVIKRYTEDYPEPTSEDQEQFRNEMELKAEELIPIGSYFRTVFYSDGGFKRDNSVENLYQKLEDSDDEIREFLQNNKKIIAPYFKVRELFFNKLHNRDLLGYGEERRFVNLLSTTGNKE